MSCVIGPRLPSPSKVNATSAMNSTLDDELTSINAIFNPNTLSLLESLDPDTRSDLLPNTVSGDATAAAVSCALRLPSRASISLRLTFPASYPEECPSVSGLLTAGNERTKKGEGARLQDLVKDALVKVWVQGEPCIYDLVEECEAALGAGEIPQADHDDTGSDQGQQIPDCDTANPTVDGIPSQLHLQDVSPQWTLSEPVMVKDSTFLARAAIANSPTEARAFIAHLVATDKRVARATHNITAWRIRVHPGSDADSKTEVIYQDSDDDGESAAGARVLKLMQMLDVWNVVVIVSRWFGGTLLGPERFRCIGVVARDALVEGGFVEIDKGSRQDSGNRKAEGQAAKGKRKK